MPERRLVRLVLQQCTSAQLDISGVTSPASQQEGDEQEHSALHKYGAPDDDDVIRIGPGLVIFVCFLAGCDEATVGRAAAAALSARLSEPPDGGAARRTAVTALPGDVLVVPQATLGGQLKGRQFQYHGNVPKADGGRLYAAFVTALAEGLSAAAAWTAAGCRLRCGRYGARQVLSTATNGPYTHIIEL